MAKLNLLVVFLIALMLAAVQTKAEQKDVLANFGDFVYVFCLTKCRSKVLLMAACEIGLKIGRNLRLKTR